MKLPSFSSAICFMSSAPVIFHGLSAARRWFGGGWKVNADLPTTEAFEAASQFVRPEDVADSISCGPDIDAHVEAVSAYWEAGFTDIAVVQIGDEGQQRFLDEAARPLLEALRNEGMDLVGPLPADTAFLPAKLRGFDAVLAMYHDQGLPVLKYSGFERAVNITLGLPYPRVAVDHDVDEQPAAGVGDHRARRCVAQVPLHAHDGEAREGRRGRRR